MKTLLAAILLIAFLSISFSDNYCVGATANFTCNQSVTESCTLNGDMAINGSNCFSITASNLVIDCNGYTLTGNKTINGYAVYGVPRSNLTVQNCIFNNWREAVYVYDI